MLNTKGNELLIAILVVLLVLIIVYFTKAGKEIKGKCIRTSTILYDSVVDIGREDLDDMYNETDGDFYNQKASMTLKRSLAKQDKKKTAKDNFRIGNIYRYYRQDPRMARHYYKLTLNDLRANPEQGNDNMIDRIEEFDGMEQNDIQEIPNIRELIAEDRMVREILNMGIARRPPQNPDVNEVEVVARRIVTPTIKPAKIENIKVIGADKKKQYLDGLVKYTKDPQTVHDSHVTQDIADHYKKITESLPPSDKSNSDFIREIKGSLEELKNKGEIDADKYNRASTVIDTMKNGAPFSKTDSTERDVLVNVWRRINMPQNKEHFEELKISLAEGLADSRVYNNFGLSTVCTGGRVARVMGSLAHLDSDPSVGVLKTKEMVRNEIFQAASHEFDSLLKEGEDDKLATPEYNEGAKDLNKGLTTLASDKFEDLAKKKIEGRIRREYTELVDKKDLDILVRESLAAF